MGVDNLNYVPSINGVSSGYGTQVNEVPRHMYPLQSDPNMDCAGVMFFTTKGNIIQAPHDDSDQTERKAIAS